MGSTDQNNHLRATATVRRSGQCKWTKKFVEFIIDICHTNAFVIYRRYHLTRHNRNRIRTQFIQELITGLLYIQGKVHIQSQLKTRRHCTWEGCRPREYNHRQPLQEVANEASPYQTSKTQDYCEQCMKSLCIGKGCWAAYHKANNLLIRPEDDP
jgi:hypothetical protein